MDGLHKKPIDITSRSQIMSLVTTVSKSRVRLWQKDQKVRKFSFCKIVQIDENRGRLLLETADDSDLFGFCGDHVYFYSSVRSLIFKAKIEKIISKNRMVLLLPQLVKIEDSRTEKRKNWGYRSYQFLDMSIVTRDLSKKNIEKTRVLDSSDNGVGIILNILDAKDLKVGSKLITMTSSIESIENRVGVIRSLSFLDNDLSGERFVRVGVELLSI